jgi:allophanate hydrolase subunit 1
VIELERYIDDLEQILSRYFKVTKHPVVADRSFLLSAHHSHTMARTLITQKDVIDKYDIQKSVLITTAQNMQQVLELSRWLKKHIGKIAKPNSENYLTLINLVVIFSNPVTIDVRKFIENYTLTKSFLLSLHGWAQVGITGVCLLNGEVFCGKRVVEMKQLFDPVQHHNPSTPNPKPTQTENSVVNKLH